MKPRRYIETSERDSILRQLRRKGKWTTRRNGVRIRFWTRTEPNGRKICFQLFPRASVTVHGVVCTISDAIDACNQVLDPTERPKPAPKPTMLLTPFPAPLIRQEWLPYRDN